MTKRPRAGDPVGIIEIADRLGVARVTVDKWIGRDWTQFPEPTWTVGGRPAWDWRDVWDWAKETNRLDPPPPRGKAQRRRTNGD